MTGLNVLPISEYKEEFKLQVFVETGTEGGYGVSIAERAAFEKIYSCEINVGRCEKVKELYKKKLNVHIECTSSIEAFTKWFPIIEGKPALFWLDAHFPIEYLKPGHPRPLETNFPLMEELKLIRTLRNHSLDVMIMDDIRVLEPELRGKLELNNYFNEEDIPKLIRVDEIKSMFSSTHIGELISIGETLLVLKPRGNK